MLSAKPKFHQAAQKTDPQDLLALSTYIYLFSTTVPVRSSELGPLHPQTSVSPRNQRGGGTHSPGGEGVGVPIWTTGEKALYSLHSLGYGHRHR
jgi:hypothetical protein